MFLKIENLNKSYGKNTILKDFNLEINKNELICLLGLVVVEKPPY